MGGLDLLAGLPFKALFIYVGKALFIYVGLVTRACIQGAGRDCFSRPGWKYASVQLLFLFFLLQLLLLRQNRAKRVEASISEFGKRRYLHGL